MNKPGSRFIIFLVFMIFGVIIAIQIKALCIQKRLLPPTSSA
jgi:hypothetical protein